MSESENRIYLLGTPGIDSEQLPTPTTTIFHRQGIVIKLKQTGHVPNPSYGSWLISFTLENGQFFQTHYVDHQCCHDIFSQPIEADLVPCEVKEILGKTLEEIQNLHSNWIFTEFKK